MKTALETWCAGILDNCLHVYWGKTNVLFGGNSDSDLKMLSEWEQRWKRGERRVQSSSSWRKDTDCQVNNNVCWGWWCWCWLLIYWWWTKLMIWYIIRKLDLILGIFMIFWSFCQKSKLLTKVKQNPHSGAVLTQKPTADNNFFKFLYYPKKYQW